jgi:glycosyltransferase involved in cell wall biosynthesis
VVFDANVNYYEIWGDYVIPGTKPTEQQRRDAVWMTERADWVVADSSYIELVVRKITDRVSHIADNVNLDIYAAAERRQSAERRRLSLVWSGIAKKAGHLQLMADVFDRLPPVSLTVVADEDVDLSWLSPKVERSVVRFTDRDYAKILRESDVIISPKYLVNGYEMGHTEYKITLGMAMGLPAVASPQASYVEAILHGGGGIVAHTPYEWELALTRLATDPSLRADLGGKARQTVVGRYATPVIAGQYLDLLRTVRG